MWETSQSNLHSNAYCIFPTNSIGMQFKETTVTFSLFSMIIPRGLKWILSTYYYFFLDDWQAQNRQVMSGQRDCFLLSEQAQLTNLKQHCTMKTFNYTWRRTRQSVTKQYLLIFIKLQGQYLLIDVSVNVPDPCKYSLTYVKRYIRYRFLQLSGYDCNWSVSQNRLFMARHWNKWKPIVTLGKLSNRELVSFSQTSLHTTLVSCQCWRKSASVMPASIAALFRSFTDSDTPPLHCELPQSGQLHTPATLLKLQLGQPAHTWCSWSLPLFKPPLFC